jgi:hypothetical protein
MPEQLKIIIDAEVQKAVGGIQILSNQLERLQKLASLPNLSFKQYERLNLLINKTQGEINRFNRAALAAPTALNKLSQSSGQATLAMVNLGRVVQDAPFGFLGIANNLNPLLESFQRLKASTGSTGGAIKALVSSLGGAGGLGFALSLVSTALILFGDKLFGSTQKARENKEALDALKKSIQGVKDETDSLTNAISFANKLGAINVQIFGQGDLEDLRQQSLANVQLVFDLQQETLKAEENYNAALKILQNKRNDDTEALVRDALASFREAQGKETEARNNQRIIYRQIELQKVKDAKQAQEKALSDYEKYVNDMIARGKELAKFFEDILIVPQFSILDTKAEMFAKAKRFVDELARGFFTVKNFNIKITPKLIIAENEVPVIIEPVINQQIQDNLFDELKEKFQQPLEVDLTLNPSFVKSVDDFAKAFAQLGERGRLAFAKTDFSEGFDEAIKSLQSLQEEFAITQEFANTLGNSFATIFDAIISGKDPIKAFFDFMIQELTRLIAKLIATKVAAAFLNFAFPGAGAAAGGLPFGFTPQAAIGMRGIGGIRGGGGFGTGSLAATGVLRGNDILISVTRTGASITRTIG